MSDISVTAASVVASAAAQTAWGVAGATITAGQTLYKDAANSNVLKLADADASAAAANCVGIALNGAASGQPVQYTWDDPDFTPGATLTLSVASAKPAYVLSATAGGIAPAADLAANMYPVYIMTAKSTTKAVLKINPQVTAALTA